MTIAMLNVLNAAFAHADTLPTRQRALLYRDIAKVCGDEPEARAINTCADDLLRADQRCLEFVFSFSQKKDRSEQKPL